MTRREAKDIAFKHILSSINTSRDTLYNDGMSTEEIDMIRHYYCKYSIRFKKLATKDTQKNEEEQQIPAMRG